MRNAAILCLAVLGLAGCPPDRAPVSASGAEQIQPYRVPKNGEGHTVEQQNIDDRIKVTTDPTKVMWIHLIGLDGKIIRRMPVRGKVTSSGKRLEPTKTLGNYISQGAYPVYNGWYVDELIEPDGTYGSSDAYIFWFDPMGRYHQWGTAGGLGYLTTDYPIDLENPSDKISGLYNADKAASAWQREQEAALKANSGHTQ